MEKFQNLHAAILNRRRESAAYYYPDPWWEKEVAAITDDLKTAIEFIDADCSDEEFYWLGEVFEDIMDKTRSADFLARPHQRRTPEWKAELLKVIRTAAQTGQVVLGIASAASGDVFLVTIILELEERS